MSTALSVFWSLVIKLLSSKERKSFPDHFSEINQSPCLPGSIKVNVFFFINEDVIIVGFLNPPSAPTGVSLHFPHFY